MALVAFWGIGASAQTKDWTFLVFINGNNSLDSYGEVNLKQMETVGSTANINVVVQWASSAASGDAKRLLVQKSTDPSKVTSPVLQDLGKTDMGDYRTLVDFVKWAVANYPAKHYFLDLWNHGSGWHDARSAISPRPLDISFDDLSGNSITTAQTGVAMAQIAQIIGHKIDLLANDACLMAMVEIGKEVANSVEVYAGSEELEPSLGWPYDKILARWVSQPGATAADIARMVTEEYVNSFIADGKDLDDATYSAFDLSRIDAVDTQIGRLAAQLRQVSGSELAAVQKAASQTQTFDDGDYLDVGDLVTNLAAQRLPSLSDETLTSVRQAVSDLVIESRGTSKYTRATGATIWLPQVRSNYDQYISLYRQLQFDLQTSWSSALATLISSQP